MGIEGTLYFVRVSLPNGPRRPRARLENGQEPVSRHAANPEPTK